MLIFHQKQILKRSKIGVWSEFILEAVKQTVVSALFDFNDSLTAQTLSTNML